MQIPKTNLFEFKHLSDFKSLNTNLDLDTTTVHIRPEDYETKKEEDSEDNGDEHSRQNSTLSIEDESLVHRINTAISILHLAAGGLQQINEIIHEMLNLCVELSSGRCTQEVEKVLIEDFKRLQGHLDDISETTLFRDYPLLDGSYKCYSLDYGFGSPSSDSVDIRLDQLDSRPFKLGLCIEPLPGYFEPIKLDSVSNAPIAVEKLEHASQLMFDRHMMLTEYFCRYETILLLVQDTNQTLEKDDIFNAVEAHDCALSTRSRLEAEFKKARRIQAENRPAPFKDRNV